MIAALMLVGLLVQDPAVARVGRVTVMYWETDARAALAMAELADRAGDWPGLPDAPLRRIRLIVTGDDARFDSLTARRLPEWGVAAAFPATNTIVLRLSAPDPLRALRHELAHLALHSVVSRVPRWLDEGYAARAAGEWDRLDALQVNWTLVRGAVPTLDGLNRHLRGPGSGEAGAAYALATTAVLLLERWGGERGLEPLLGALAETGDLDQALRRTHQVTLGQFEDQWQRDLRRRYGWLLVFTSFTVFWAVMALLLVVLWWWRRRRNRERRAVLDEGWTIPEDYWNPNA